MVSTTPFQVSIFYICMCLYDTFAKPLFKESSRAVFENLPDRVFGNLPDRAFENLPERFSVICRSLRGFPAEWKERIPPDYGLPRRCRR